MKRIAKHMSFLMKAEFLLIAGSLFGLAWANGLLVDVNPDLTFENFNKVKHYVLWENEWLGHEPHAHVAEDGHDEVIEAHEHPDDGVKSHGLKQLTIEFLVLDMLFPLFFAFAAIEIYEERMKGGALHDLKKAMVPIMMTIGGVLFPIGFYLLAAFCFGKYDEMQPGWLVCTATDIAFAAIAANWAFGSGHPAKAFIMVIAVVDDGIGLFNIAVFLNQGGLDFQWLILVVIACGLTLLMKKKGVQNMYAYLPAMALSWIGFYATGIHPSLGFVPVVFCMPRPPEKVAAGVFADAEDVSHRTDPLGVFEHKFETLVAFILGAFGFLNAGIVWTGLETESVITLIGIIGGKVVGITVFGCIAAAVFGLPEGLRKWHIPLIGLVCAIAFTVGMFVTLLSPFGVESLRSAVMMGCVLSVLLVPVCGFIAFACGVRRITPDNPLVAP